MEKVSSSQEVYPSKPSPLDFELYLPWACKQLQEPYTVIVTKLQQNDYVSVSAISERSKSKSKYKNKISKSDMTSDQEKDSTTDVLSTAEYVIKIQAVYDTSNNLVQLKFDRNRSIPQNVMKIIALIIKFQVNLHTIVINRGLNQYVIYELSKFLPFSHITDVCLDNTFTKEANYSILLEKENFITHLSLSRCSIVDSVVETIVNCLVYPMPSSKTLSILNLSSNKITNMGASYIAKALRSNRQLRYLNLADNKLMDAGADDILSILSEFPITADELLESKRRLVNYLKHKTELITQITKDLRNVEDIEKSSKKNKVDRKAMTTTPKKKGLEKEEPLKTTFESKSHVELEAILLEKANTMAINVIGEFNEPFSETNIITHDDLPYCYGNNALCYLNMSYNNVTYITVKKLLNVLVIQKRLDRKPRGLVNINIEGNNLPVNCEEFLSIDILLEQGLIPNERKLSGTKKRPISKSGSRVA